MQRKFSMSKPLEHSFVAQHILGTESAASKFLEELNTLFMVSPNLADFVQALGLWVYISLYITLTISQDVQYL